MESIKRAASSSLKRAKKLLRDKKFRGETGRFIAEGDKIVHDALANPGNVESVLCSDSYIRSNPGRIKELLSGKTDVFSVKNIFFDNVSVLRNSQGILAVCEKPRYDLSLLKQLNNKRIILLDNIQDPGNTGTLIRSAAAFNVGAVLLYGKTADVYNPKVVRASSGTVLKLPLVEIPKKDLSVLKEYGFDIICADNSRDASVSIFDVKISEAGNIIVFGNEGGGISPEIMNITDTVFYIPVSERVESLNVAMAGCISMFHFMDVTVS
jgi:TrmH family RNA methyltransferase